MEKEKGKQREQNRYTNKAQISIQGENCKYSNQLNDQCNKHIGLYINRMYISRLSIRVHDIKAPTFRPTVHKNLESILVLGV